MTTDASRSNRSVTELLVALGLALATALAWWLWLTRDTEYQIDPATGVESGPYEEWQVVGLVLTLIALAISGGLTIRPWIVIVAMTAASTLSFAVPAAAYDDTGLWAVGAFLVTTGMLMGTAVVSYGAWLVKHLGRGRSD